MIKITHADAHHLGPHTIEVEGAILSFLPPLKTFTLRLTANGEREFKWAQTIPLHSLPPLWPVLYNTFKTGFGESERGVTKEVHLEVEAFGQVFDRKTISLR